MSLKRLPYEHIAVTGSSRVKRGMAEMLKGGVIMDVVNVEQARLAEDAGAVAVMALERVPADIRAQGGVSRMSDPDMIDSIVEAGSGIFKSGNPAERAESRSNRCPDARELRALGRRLGARQGTFAFAHARLAWLESYGGQEAP